MRELLNSRRTDIFCAMGILPENDKRAVEGKEFRFDDNLNGSIVLCFISSGKYWRHRTTNSGIISVKRTVSLDSRKSTKIPQETVFPNEFSNSFV